jgi:hypothetical protein
MKTISKTTKAAASLNAVFPSFKEIVNDPKYGISIFEQNPGARFQIMAAKIYEAQSKSVKKCEIVYAEVIAYFVQVMVKQMRGSDFYGFYDMNHQKGVCEVYSYAGRSYTLNPEEFFAIIKIFWFSHLGISFSDEQIEAYKDFKDDPRISSILD